MSAPVGPGHDARAGQEVVRCPFCGAEEAEPLSLFGSQLLTEQWYCLACHTPFERIKDGIPPTPGRLPKGPSHEPNRGA